MWRPPSKKEIIAAIVGAILLIAIAEESYPGEMIKLPPRMTAIAEKFGIAPVCMLQDSKTGKVDLWLFAIKSNDLTFEVCPIQVPANATDHDVQIAIDSARVVAKWYELHIKQKQTETAYQ